MMTNLNPVGYFPCSSAQAPGDPLLCRELMGSCTHAAAPPAAAGPAAPGLCLQAPLCETWEVNTNQRLQYWQAGSFAFLMQNKYSPMWALTQLLYVDSLQAVVTGVQRYKRESCGEGSERCHCRGGVGNGDRCKAGRLQGCTGAKPVWLAHLLTGTLDSKGQLESRCALVGCWVNSCPLCAAVHSRGGGFCWAVSVQRLVQVWNYRVCLWVFVGLASLFLPTREF